MTDRESAILDEIRQTVGPDQKVLVRFKMILNLVRVSSVGKNIKILNYSRLFESSSSRRLFIEAE